jgi:hypothetical protein
VTRRGPSFWVVLERSRLDQRWVSHLAPDFTVAGVVLVHEMAGDVDGDHVEHPFGVRRPDRRSPRTMEV